MSVKTSKRKRTSAPVAEATTEAAEPAAALETPASVVVLPSVCTIKDAAGLKESLCKVADLTSRVTLDIRAVERIDTAIIQLLYAFVRDRAGRSAAVTWLGAPPAVLDAASLLGVHALIGLPEKESAGAAT